LEVSNQQEPAINLVSQLQTGFACSFGRCQFRRIVGNRAAAKSGWRFWQCLVEIFPKIHKNSMKSVGLEARRGTADGFKTGPIPPKENLLGGPHNENKLLGSGASRPAASASAKGNLFKLGAGGPGVGTERPPPPLTARAAAYGDHAALAHSQ